MGNVTWIKLSTNMFDNRKIKHLRRLPDGDSMVLIWVQLLCLAGRCNAGGLIFLTEDIMYTPEDLADELDFEVSTVKLALTALDKLGMIQVRSDGILITDWEGHQNLASLDKAKEQNRQRVANYRQKQKELAVNSDCNGDCNGDVMLPVTQCNGTDIDIDKDKDKDIENKNIDSTNLYIGGKDIYIERESEREKNESALPPSIYALAAEDKAAESRKEEAHPAGAKEDKAAEPGEKKVKKKKTASGSRLFAEFAGDNEKLYAALNDFASFRQKIKKPLTDRAGEMVVNRLREIARGPDEMVQILYQSIYYGWTGVFPLKNDFYKAACSDKPDAMNALKDLHEQYRNEMIEENPNDKDGYF